jgi:hypothetical protein
MTTNNDGGNVFVRTRKIENQLQLFKFLGFTFKEVVDDDRAVIDRVETFPINLLKVFVTVAAISHQIGSLFAGFGDSFREPSFSRARSSAEEERQGR